MGQNPSQVIIPSQRKPSKNYDAMTLHEKRLSGAAFSQQHEAFQNADPTKVRTNTEDAFSLPM